MQTLFLTDLQEERTIAERETAVHTFSATDAEIVVNDVLEVGRLHFPTGKRIDRAPLVFRPFVSCKGLRIEKTGAKITIATHREIVETFDRRDHFGAFVRTNSATDTFFGIDLPNRRVADDFLFFCEKTNGTEQSGGNAVSATRFQQRASGGVRFHSRNIILFICLDKREGERLNPQFRN